MLNKRLIPCLDIKDGRIVKGVKFLDLQDAGDPVCVAQQYEKEGADELCFLDITASSQKRKIVLELVREIANHIFIPFTVGGGLRNLSDIEAVLHAGADKVSLNTSAFERSKLLSEASSHFGSQCIVCAIDAKRKDHTFEVYLHGGRTATGRNAIEWARQACEEGAGEILLTSMDRDGTKLGYDIALLKAVREVVSVPVIASGGVGNLDHFSEAILLAKADAVLAASIFHFGEYSIEEVKNSLKEKGIPVRIEASYV